MEFCYLFVYFGDLPDLVLRLISVVLSMDDSPDPCPLVTFGFIWRYFLLHFVTFVTMRATWSQFWVETWKSKGRNGFRKLTIRMYMVWQHPSSNGIVHQPHVMRSASCFLMCAAELRSSLHSQFQCWCSLNFKSSSKFPRSSATLSNITLSWIYPCISQLIGSATQLQALREHFSNRFGGLPVPPLRFSLLSTTRVIDLFLQSFFIGLLGGRSLFAFVWSPMHLLEDLYIPVSEPAGICHPHSKGLPTLFSTIYSWKLFN